MQNRSRTFTTILLGLLALIAQPAAASEDGRAPVELGVTDLLAAFSATVGYACDGQEEVTLGNGWNGMDDVSGVWFEPDCAPGAVSELFIHCPYKTGPGVAFGEYRLQLPATNRIRLAFRIALRSSVTGSDGVTYRARANGKVIFEQHCTWKDFGSFEADLTPWAGKRVSLRLEVDPGPQREPREDWSLWRDVQILAGNDRELAESRTRKEAQLAKLREEAVQRGSELANESLLSLSSLDSDSARPGVLHPVENDMQRDGAQYVFTCKGDETIEYRFDPKAGLLGGLRVSVDGRELSPSPFKGGPRVAMAEREYDGSSGQLKMELLEAADGDGRLVCRYRYTHSQSGESAELKATLWATGKSLALEVASDGTAMAGFHAKPYGGREAPTAFAVGGPPQWRAEGVYVATVTDVMRSEASNVGRVGTRYATLTDGVRNPMHDFFYLTVSSRYEETLANVTHKPSPFLEDLSGRVVLDAWRGAFADDEKWLDEMAAYGVNHFLIIKHVWQRDGYDRTYPDVMPANAAQGGDGDLRSLSMAAQRIGHRFCVHENFYDYYPNAEDFVPEHRALESSGKPQRGWDRGPVVAAFLKPTRLMEYARRFSPEVKRRYDCDAAYHDIMPTWHVDFDAKAADAGKIRVTHEITRELCDFDRKLFGGPVVFEAADANMAGVYDGGCNHGRDTYKTPAAVAYELLKVHPKMSNHGFGYYERWLEWGYNAGWQKYVMTDRELDKYRAYQVAFGRTGFIGQQLILFPHGLVREYHLMQAFARAYTGRRAERIEYLMDGRWIDAGTAARYGELKALHVAYEGGQDVYVNLGDASLAVGGCELPPFGMVTTGPRATAWTATWEGQICDFSRYGDVTYVDARSNVWQVPSDTAPIEPSVADFRYDGGDSFTLSVKWKPSRGLDRDYSVFWHFRRDGQIKMQRDFRPPRKTSEWKVGDEIVTGPQRVGLKEDSPSGEYSVVVGLYSKQGRPALLGDAEELQIGRLIVTREGGKIAGIRLERTEPVGPPGTLQEPYREGMNAARKVIDFGSLATNGAVVAVKTDDGLQVTPVPRGEVMTVGVPGKVEVEARGGDGSKLPGPKIRHEGGKSWFETSEEAGFYLVKSR